MIASYPVDGTAQGTLVLTPGDILYPFKRYVESEVRIAIKDGYVVDVTGGLDAFLIADYLASWEEPEVYATSHMGFGMLPRAQWSAMAFYEKADILGMDGRSVQGNFLFSTGPNRFTGRARRSPSRRPDARLLGLSRRRARDRRRHARRPRIRHRLTGNEDR